MTGPEAGFQLHCQLEEGQRLATVGLLRRVDATDDDHEPTALYADQHIGIEVASRAAQHVDIQDARGRSHENTHGAVAVPAERGDPTREFRVVFAGEDRVDHERLKAGIPESAGFRRPRVHVGGGERNLPRVQQDPIAQ